MRGTHKVSLPRCTCGVGWRLYIELIYEKHGNHVSSKFCLQAGLLPAHGSRLKTNGHGHQNAPIMNAVQLYL